MSLRACVLRISIALSTSSWRRDSTRFKTTQTCQICGEHMTIKAVIFDLDGTLVDTAPDLMAATNHVLSLLRAAAHHHGGSAQLCGAWRQDSDRARRAATGDAIDEASLTYYLAEFLRYYEATRQTGVKFSRASWRCSSGWPIPASRPASAPTSRKAFRVSFSSAGPRRFFGAIVGPDTIGIGKPDPAPYLETVRRLGVGHRIPSWSATARRIF